MLIVASLTCLSSLYPGLHQSPNSPSSLNMEPYNCITCHTRVDPGRPYTLLNHPKNEMHFFLMKATHRLPLTSSFIILSLLATPYIHGSITLSSYDKLTTILQPWPLHSTIKQHFTNLSHPYLPFTNLLLLYLTQTLQFPRKFTVRNLIYHIVVLSNFNFVNTYSLLIDPLNLHSHVFCHWPANFQSDSHSRPCFSKALACHLLSCMTKKYHVIYKHHTPTNFILDIDHSICP